MPTTTLNLIKGDKTSVDTDYRDALPVNMYPVIRNILGAEGYMLCYPGLTQHATGIGVDRAGNYNERFTAQYRVSGEALISVSTTGVVTDLGSIQGSSQASMPYSFTTQAIIADGRMYYYDPVGGYRENTDADLGTPIDGTWIDGYYFLTDGEYLYHTDITDEEAIDPLKFATAEFSPDPTLGVAKTQDNKAIVFGRYSTEYFANTASENFAFKREDRRAQKIGIVATHAKCEVAGKFYITGGRKDESVGVHIIGVGNSEKISSREVDKLLAEYTEPALADMRMESRMDGNVTFILVHLPNTTLCFNETVAKKFGIDVAWSILKSDIAGNTVYRGINGVSDARLGKWVFGDKQGTSIGYLDNTVSTQYGNAVEWILFTPLINLENMSVDEVEIETIPGHTLATDATVAISVTLNGITYGKEWFEMYGEPLDYGKRFIIRRVCYVSDWVGFKLRGATTSRMAFAGIKIKHG